ncbi:MAG: hypothetical protein ACYDEQ_01925 [Desulfocucumaceae bacterium]
MKTIVFKLIAFAAVIALTAGCAEDTVKGSQVKLDELANTLTLNEAGFIAKIKRVNTKGITKGIEPEGMFTVTDVVPMKRGDLDNMKTVVKSYYGNESAGMAVPGFGGVALGKDEANLNIYFVETKAVKHGTDTLVYGIGYSMHYLFKKVKKKVNVADLPFIAASVQLEKNKTQVSYSLQTYGVIGPELSRYFEPMLDAPFDVNGYGEMKSSLAGIHNVLSDTVLSKTVKFTPGVLPFVNTHDIK